MRSADSSAGESRPNFAHATPMTQAHTQADANMALQATTPAGLQSAATLARRRALALALNLALYAGLAAWLWSILAAGGWSVVDAAFFAAYLMAAPWAVLGCVNAGLGLWLLRLARNGVADTAPFLAAGDIPAPLREKVAIAMTVRNENPARALDRLRRMEAEMATWPEAGAFSYHLLSDTSDAGVAAEEERLIALWRAERPQIAGRIHYRRRDTNKDFKAGNMREFCVRSAADTDSMILLDADSFMRAGTLVRMARIAEAWPRIGILQSLVVGAPSRAGFARLFQYGMRAGMRSYTMGASWWTGDCGPFWGHNALIRLAPFVDHCALPRVPGGPILSHDQVEAALMRRGGYEVRVMPVETDSFEENPPDMVEFSTRDLRWCRGNMQYWRLLGLPGLKPVSRFQLVWAISMFLGLPAGQALIALAALKPFDGELAAAFPTASAVGFLVAHLLVALSPKLAGFAEVALGREAWRYGGARLFATGAALELAASFLTSAAVAFRTTLYLVGLPFGRALVWGSQRRDANALSWREAAAAFWPGTLFGCGVVALLAVGAPAALPFAAPFVAGLVLAIPFAVLTAAPDVGAFMVRRRLCATPEEIAQADGGGAQSGAAVSAP